MAVPVDDMLACVSMTSEQKQVTMADMARMVEESNEKLAWDAMTKPGVLEIGPTIKEEDFDCLRDLLVDMCSATTPEHPPSQEDWTQIRDQVRAAAVKHSLLNRDEKKAVKKPSMRPSIAMPPRHGKSLLASQLALAGTKVTLSPGLSGRSADLLIIDDVSN